MKAHGQRYDALLSSRIKGPLANACKLIYVLHYYQTHVIQLRHLIDFIDRPIQSYRNQGATKSGLVVEDHAVIYTGLPGAQPPQLYAGEEAIVKQALRVHPINGSESLNVSSRINFGKPYAVEHNVKLAEIGIIAQEHLHLLVTYFYEAMGLA